MLPSAPSGSGGAVVVQDPDLDAGERPADARCLRRQAGRPAGQAGPGDEAQLGGAVVLEDGGIRRPAAGRLQRPGIQLGTGADDGLDAGGVHAAGQPALTEQPQHGGDQDQAGDAVMADGGVDVADVEGLQRVEFGAGVKALGQGIEVQAGRERARSERLIVLA